MSKHRTLSLLNFLFQKPRGLRKTTYEAFLTGSRSFSRVRQIPESIGRKQAAATKDEYKQRMFERARQRRSSMLEKEKSTDAEIPSSSTAVMMHNAVQEQIDESTEEEEAEEEEALDEYRLFSGLLNYQQPNERVLIDRYVPFQISEDDEEQDSDKEDDPTEQWFVDKEEDMKLAREEEQALYPEEEVPVKLIDFVEESHEGPVILKMADSCRSNDLDAMLYLRRIAIVLSTKTKLFERLNQTKETTLDQLDLHEIASSDQLLVLREIQSFLDWCMVDNADIGHALFKQLREDAPKSIQHFREITELVPPNLSFQQLIRSVPALVLIKNKEVFDFGLECIGSVYPSLNDCKERFKLGSIPAELLENVIHFGRVLLSVQGALPWGKETSLSRLLTLIEEADLLIPNLPKIIESTANGLVAPATVASVLLNPSLTRRRIESCKQSIYNWANFNLYAYGDFTLHEDETKFRNFCEMYNMTRRLQMELAEEFRISQEAVEANGDGQKEMHQRRKTHQLHSGILPKQFVAMYNAYELLKEEGMTWPVFLKGMWWLLNIIIGPDNPSARHSLNGVCFQGLSILSEQKEVGVYAELHFYEKLRKSNTRNVASIVLRDGLVSVMRMMCQEEQLTMENEPSASETPLFEITPMVYEHEIFC